MDKTDRRALIGVTVGHGAHDTWYGLTPVLLAALSGQVQLANSEIGFMLLIYQTLSSFTQPLFGRLSERYGGRLFAVGSILYTTTIFSLALFAPSKFVLGICILLAGLGSGAWHPQGAANATASGGERWGATTASVFFQGGTLGSAFLGAALGGYLLSTYGRHSLLIISVITVLLSLTVVRSMVPARILLPHKPRQTLQGENDAAGRAFWIIFGFLLLATALRSLVYHSLNTYIPKFEQDQGTSPAVYGLVMSMYMVASAVGGMVGSYLADRLGIREVLAASLVIAGLLLFGFMRTEGVLSYALFAIAGFFLSPSHTLFVVAAQRRFPQRVAMISGVFLGFTFVSGAGGGWILGLLADRSSLGYVLGALPWILLIAGVFSLAGVPGRLRKPAVETSPSVT